MFLKSRKLNRVWSKENGEQTICFSRYARRRTPYALRSAAASARIAAVMKNYLWKYLLPGILLILCAFWAGTLPSMIFSLLSFLSFFLAGVALILEGRKRCFPDTLENGAEKREIER